MTSPSIHHHPGLRSAGLIPRQKRKQVARACDGCRTQRVKCDDSVPCSNCAAKGIACSNSSDTKMLSLQQARGEIERLNTRVKELEAQLRNSDRIASQSQPPASDVRVPLEPYSENLEQPVTSVWSGIQLRPPRSPHASWFGPASLQHFTSRLSAFLDTNFGRSDATDSILPRSESSEKLTGTSHPHSHDQTRFSKYPGLGSTGIFLTPIQEEYFIDLFWQTYHTSMCVILDETEFKKHYHSLWISNSSSRKDSALVDVVIAMCMQYGISSLPSERQGSIIEGEDATLAGRWHYHRGWTLLAGEMESPTISTLQCYLLCATYLCGGSFHNMVDSACGLAVRTAYQLGLHVEPPLEASEGQRQLRRRLWWAVYILDSKIGAKLGRPFFVSNSSTAPLLPEDSFEAAKLSGSSFAPIGPETTWLSFGLYQIKLYALVRAAHTAIYSTDVSLPPGHTVWEHPWALEAVAGRLTPHMKHIADWVRQLPASLKTHRKDGGAAYSNTRSTLDIEQFAPAWLQRQRIVLEGLYHHLCICLLRPFITFGIQLKEGSLVEANAKKCVNHAIELSKFLQQVVSSTSILHGWHEAFQWQWSAALTLVGFISANPTCSLVSEVRESLDVAISVLEFFGTSFAASASASAIIKNLYARISSSTIQPSSQDTISADSRLTLGLPLENQPSRVDRVTTENDGLDNFQPFSNTEGSFNFDDFDLCAMAATVDFWEDLNTLWPGPSHSIGT